MIDFLKSKEVWIKKMTGLALIALSIIAPPFLVIEARSISVEYRSSAIDKNVAATGVALENDPDLRSNELKRLPEGVILNSYKLLPYFKVPNGFIIEGGTGLVMGETSQGVVILTVRHVAKNLEESNFSYLALQQPHLGDDEIKIDPSDIEVSTDPKKDLALIIVTRPELIPFTTTISIADIVDLPADVQYLGFAAATVGGAMFRTDPGASFHVGYFSVNKSIGSYLTQDTYDGSQTSGKGDSGAAIIHDGEVIGVLTRIDIDYTEVLFITRQDYNQLLNGARPLISK